MCPPSNSSLLQIGPCRITIASPLFAPHESYTANTMTDWEKLRVADLKEELKNRGIPLTGLKLKQQFIDKLNELDSGLETNDNRGLNGDAESQLEHFGGDNAIVHEQDHDEIINGSKEAVPSAGAPAVMTREESENTQKSPSKEKFTRNGTADEVTPGSDGEGDVKEQSDTKETPEKDEQISPDSNNELTGEERVQKLPEDLPAELKKEESQARDDLTPEPVVVKSAEEAKAINEDDLFVPQDPTETEDGNDMHVDESEQSVHEDTAKNSAPVASNGLDSDKEVKTRSNEIDSTPVPTPDLMDDQRKRKRRSITPTPGSGDNSQKKLKLNDGSVSPVRRESDALDKMQEATDAAQATRNLDISGDKTHFRSNHKTDQQDVVMEDANATPDKDKDVPGQISPKHHEQRSARRSLSQSSQERDVSPARHPATRSLYIRNFKRPLNIPTLRNHISSLAGSSAEDSLKVFYLDSIRTHALISLTSISAASRVRNAMHGTKFPDEPMREPLWIDFIPDEKVQGWIDQETGSGSNGLGGGRNSSTKFEVVYEDQGDAVEAVLREVSSNNNNNQSHRPNIAPSRSNRTLPQDSTVITAAGPGVHPSRAPLIPQVPAAPRSQQQARAIARPSDPGKGFQALDELFSSTTSKPKIYYKLPARSVIDDRLDLMRDLRVTHEQMGQTGDEGMKRYSFEKDDRSRQEVWVDKGPEFGFGRRGQERLTGYGNAYGGGRGRGGFRGARRGDSWRGR